MQKKIITIITAFTLSITFLFSLMSCDLSEGNNIIGPDLSDFVKVNGGTVEGAVADSKVFIEGRTVTIRDLYVCEHEVTQKEFKKYMKIKCVGEPEGSQFYSGNGDNYPVFWESWYSAIMYCNLRSKAEGLTPVYYIEIEGKKETDVDKWHSSLQLERFVKEDGKFYWKGAQVGEGAWNTKLDYEGSSDPDGGIQFDENANGYRLPTEVEWEYIAREGNNGIPANQYVYSGSDDYSEVAVCGNEHSGLTEGNEIKSKEPNALNIYDMSGNAYEWVWDWFEADVNITASTPSTGPVECYSNNGGSTGRVKKGGSHNNSCYQSAISNRSYYAPGFPNNGAGFRVVRNAD
ncbi:MAG: SUMF1/EgtB/PvdO family nonheme iron enzyme [Treponema sp.]|nr:SUMF1/EgtB/PvdO family nonheme iron enzyme [Treponema sp.]